MPRDLARFEVGGQRCNGRPDACPRQYCILEVDLSKKSNRLGGAITLLYIYIAAVQVTPESIRSVSGEWRVESGKKSPRVSVIFASQTSMVVWPKLLKSQRHVDHQDKECSGNDMAREGLIYRLDAGTSSVRRYTTSREQNEPNAQDTDTDTDTHKESWHAPSS